MVFNNKHFDFLPNLLYLCALYCKTAVQATYISWDLDKNMIIASYFNEMKNEYIHIMLNTVHADTHAGIVCLFGHCIATWYAMSRYFVILTEIGTSCRRS